MEFAMIHKNREYNTKDSIKIAVFLHNENNPEKSYSRTLYKSKYGDYFFLLYGSGVSSCSIRNNKRESCGSRMFPIPEEKAKEFVNKEGVILLEEV